MRITDAKPDVARVSLFEETCGCVIVVEKYYRATADWLMESIVLTRGSASLP
jgi:hypothetical protein